MESFGFQLVVTFVAALGLSYGIGRVIDAKFGQGGPDSTLISMAFGGFLAPMILSSIAGWKAWAMKSPLVVAFIVAGLYTSNPVIGILCVIFSTAIYLVAGKCRLLSANYFPAKNLDADTGD